MTLFARTLFAATIVAIASFASVSEAEAGCGGSRFSYFRPRISVAPRRVYQPVQYSQPVIRQPIIQQPAEPAPGSGEQRPPQQPTTPPATNPQANATQTPATGNATLTALQALAGMETASTVSPVSQSPSQVGSWTAKLGNGASIRLTMNLDGTFNWTATNQSGTTSTFSGTYTVEGTTLTLIRASDNQKLSGAMTLNGNDAFNFKLAGTQDTGVDFVRA